MEVVGKGGSGKTIVAGTLARLLAANQYDVLAIDADNDPNLAVSLGVPPTDDVPHLPDKIVTSVEKPEGESSWELARPPQAIIDEYGIEAPDGVTLLNAGKVVADGGSFMRSNITVALLLMNSDQHNSCVTIVDMPAGLEFHEMVKYVDVLLMVVEPSYTSVETARKMRGFATEYDVSAVRVVVNNVRTEQDLNVVEDYCTDHGLEVTTVIPHTEVIRHAEQEGIAPIDGDDGNPAIRAIRDLATDLMST